MRPIMLLAAILCVLVAHPARALERIIIGTVGAPSGGQWPYLIGMKKGFFAAAGLELDIIYVPSAPGLIQQLVAGSLEAVATSGLVEPILASEKGAPIAIIRIIGQVPPYALIARPGIASLKDLKGKTISLGGLTDITRVYFDRMMEPNGLKIGDYDIVVAGATGARFVALKSGAVDAAILLPPLSFQAESEGFKTVGMAVDYVHDVPFTGAMVNTIWATQRKQTVAALLQAVNRSTEWFYDPAHRDESIAIMAQAVGVGRQEAEMTYDFFRKIELFERSGKVSRAQLQKLIDIQLQLGLLGERLSPDRVVLAGVTELTD